MNRTVIIIVIILAFTILIGWYLYLQHNRYYLIGSQHGVAYEINIRSYGQVLKYNIF